MSQWWPALATEHATDTHTIFRETHSWYISACLIRWGARRDAANADVIIVGAGLAGLVAAAELADAKKRVLLLDQEGEQSLGGQAFWSFGGLFLVDSPEQRRMGIRDSYALALDDWMGTAGFDRPEDEWPLR